MASVVGLMEQARAFFPDFGARRKRGPDYTEIGNSRVVPALGRSAPEPLSSIFRPISDLVEHAVVPHVVDAHRDDRQVAGKSNDWAKEALAFAALAIDADAEVILERLDMMLANGTEIETILIEVLAPASRRLGIMWEQDDCDFVDVTMGLWRLQEVVRELSGRVPARTARQQGGYRALFSPMPGDQHNFGTVIVEDVFRRAGWGTELLLDGGQGALLNALATQHFDMVGLTVTAEVHTERLPSLILAIRSVSRSPRLCILLGGPVLNADPQIAIRAGADGTAADAQQAVTLADRLVTANACREVFTA